MLEFFEDPVFQARRKIHTTIYGQCFSPCGKYLATCDNFGFISIFSLATSLSPEATEDSRKPFFTFKVQDGALYTLISTSRWLISAGNCGNIYGWLWADVLQKVSKTAWIFSLDASDRFGCPEINSIAVNSEKNETHLFAGCGDNNVYVWDLEAGCRVLTLSGHTDYIHSVCVRPLNEQCISASEDGSVRFWDSRYPKEAAQILEPYKNTTCNRPQLGKWVGSVAVDKADDWLVCGGGPSLCLWHLRSLAATAVFDSSTHCINHTMFHEDSIVAAGSGGCVNHWTVNGEKKAQVPCTPHTVYSVAINTKGAENTKVLSIAGNSDKIDICTNFGYKAFSMSV